MTAARLESSLGMADQSLHSGHRPRRIITEGVIALFGIALMVCAVLANLAWFDRHFLPTFFAARKEFIEATWAARIGVAALGITLLFVVRPRFGRLIANRPLKTLLADAARIGLAIILALAFSELALRHTVFGLASEERPNQEEPLRHRDSRLGWVFVPSRNGRDKVGGRTIEYTFDQYGYRVRTASEPVDPDRPTIVFTGESTMVGHGLTWDESIPGQVQKLLGIQAANIAVEGYATDQAYLRLAAELPRFRHPVAVVFFFAPDLFDRNLDKDRPYLDRGLVWRPGKSRWSLIALAHWLAPYRSEEEINWGIGTTRKVLSASVELARSRGAVPLIIVPIFAPEQPPEQILRNRILDQTGLPYALIQLDPTWRIPWDRHPDARGAKAIADAIVPRLRKSLPFAAEFKTTGSIRRD